MPIFPRAHSCGGRVTRMQTLTEASGQRDAGPTPGLFAAATIATWARETLMFAVLAALVVTLQITAGVYRSEVGGAPDEGGHFITGLMVHDYLVASDHRAPMRFAETYYLHYPR